MTARTVTIPRGTWGIRVATIAVALGAGFQTVRSGLGYLLSTPATVETALAIDPGNSWVMSMAADERLKTVQMGTDATALAAFSRTILRRSPYEVVALRDIGIIAAANDDERGADRLLSLAGRLSLRDYLTHAWLLDYHFRSGALTAAVREADIVLRQRPDNWDIVMPALIALTRDARVIEPLAATLATRPPWRSDFLTRLGIANPSPANIFALLNRLKALGTPPSKAELDSYFLKASETLPPRELYRQWLALLPSRVASERVALLRDGDFTGLEMPPPFGWRYFPADGIYAERGDSGPAGMGNALYAAYSGETETVFATQQLVLAAGRYRFGGRGYSESALDAGTFAWVLVCRTPGREAPLARIALNLTPNKLTGYATDFVVPDGCESQEISLIGASTGAAYDSPAIHVDGLRIDPLR